MQHPELETIVAYVEGSLPNSEWDSVDAHVTICPYCREEVELNRRLNELTDSLEEPQLSPQFFVKLSENLRASQSPKESKVIRFPLAHWMGPALAAAASLALLMGGLNIANRATPSASTQALASPTPGPAIAVVSPTPQPLPGEVPNHSNLTVAPPTPRSQEVAAAPEEEIRISPGSDFQFLSQRGEVSEFELKRGRVWIHESRVKVAVRTPHALIMPVGTEYEVFAGPRGSQVVVWEGKVGVEGSSHQNLTVGAGREARIDPSGQVGPAQPLSPTRDRKTSRSWNQRLVFKPDDMGQMQQQAPPSPPEATPQVGSDPAYPTRQPTAPTPHVTPVAADPTPVDTPDQPFPHRPFPRDGGHRPFERIRRWEQQERPNNEHQRPYQQGEGWRPGRPFEEREPERGPYPGQGPRHGEREHPDPGSGRNWDRQPHFRNGPPQPNHPGPGSESFPRGGPGAGHPNPGPGGRR